MPGLPARLGLMLSGRQPLADFTAAARQAEAAGFGRVWTGDGGGDVVALLAAAALVTNQVGLGSAVMVWHRPPVVAARAAAQLARFAPGRLVLGLGAGPREWNEDWWGIPFERPVARMKEYLTILRALLTPAEEPFSYQGTFFHLRRCPRTPPPEPIPLLLGTVGPQMNRLAGQVADGVLFDVCLPLRYLTEVAIPAVEAGLARSGRPRDRFHRAALVAAGVDPDPATARQHVKRAIAGHLAQEYFFPIWGAAGFEAEARRARERLAAGDHPGALAAISDAFAETVGLAGTADQVRHQAAAWLEVVDELVLLSPPFAASASEVAANRQALLTTFSA